jgi:excinuclease ABC subunit A
MRLRIASRLRSSQRGALYVFGEPSTGLHPRDVDTLVTVFGGAPVFALSLRCQP